MKTMKKHKDEVDRCELIQRGTLRPRQFVSVPPLTFLQPWTSRNGPLRACRVACSSKRTAFETGRSS